MNKYSEAKKAWLKRNSEVMKKAKRAWLKRNPEARKKAKKRNYDRGALHCRNSHALWSRGDDLKITATDRPCDRALSLELGRSVQAIQVRRVTIRSFSQL